VAAAGTNAQGGAVLLDGEQEDGGDLGVTTGRGSYADYAPGA
jgi:hypothetical protein